MNPEVGTNSGIPAFIAKLYHMVSDPSSDNLISWGKDGTTFIIKDHNKFSREMLPMYYKHDNMASFIRQLNMYSFRKILLVDSSSLKNKEMEFSHPYFVKDEPNQLLKIQRKIHTKEQNDVKCDPAVFNSLLKEVKQLRAIQEIFSSKLSVMKKENAALWREHSILRQRHAKQEKIVNKVIQFLISTIQQSTINVTRRKQPLMIKDRPVVMRPAPKKKFVKVVNPKSPPVICEVTSQELDDDGNLIVEMDPVELLEPYSNNDEDGNTKYVYVRKKLPNENTPVQLIQSKSELTDDIAQIQPITVNPVKRKIVNLKTTAQNAKRVKKHRVNYILPEGTSDDNYTEHDTPQYILSDDNDDISEFLQSNEEAVSSPLNSTGLLEEAEAEAPEALLAKLQSVRKNVTNPLKKIMTNSGENIDLTKNQNVSNEMTSYTMPIVTSPAASIPSPASYQSSDVPSSSEKLTNSPRPSQTIDTNSSLKNILQLALPQDINDPLKSKVDTENHLDKVQSDLDILKDLLKSDGISLDANMVLELFNDNPLDLNMGPAGGEPSSSDQALITYSPSLLDLDPPYMTTDSFETQDNEIIPDYDLNTPQIKIEAPTFPDI